MPQHDYVIDNQLFPATRTDWNSVLAAIVTNNSGTTAPATTYPYMDWIDTSSNPAVWRKRNGANNAWVTIGTCDTTNLGLATLLSPALTGTPTTPTASASTNTTQIASCAFVQSAMAVVPGWTNATLVNSWANNGGNYPSLRYRKYPNGDVQIQGVVSKTTSNAANETIFTLPAGSRPGDNHAIVLQAGLGSGFVYSGQQVLFSTTGAVQIVSANTAPNNVTYLAFYLVFKGEN